MVICRVCNKEFKKIQSRSSHISRIHKLSSKEYYDKYLKNDGEGICPICGKETNYSRCSYSKYCSHKCYSKYLELRPKELHPWFGKHRENIWNKNISDERTKSNGRKTLLTKGKKRNRLCPICGNYVKRFNKKFCSMDCYIAAKKLGLVKNGFERGYSPYNKGLTIKNSPELKEWYRNKKVSKRAGAGIAGIRNDIGHFVRSRWEANIARLLIKWNLKYEYEPKQIFIGDGYYTPDFYLSDKRMYLEVIGYLTPQKSHRLRQISELYPNFPLYIIDDIGYKMLETTYSKIIPNWEFRNSPIPNRGEIKEHAIK